MTNEEAEKYAKVMTYRDAVYNALQGKCIPYRKATLIKLYELLDRLEQQPCEDCISRQAVIILIDEASEMHPYKMVGDSDTYSNYNQGWSDACDWLYANIEGVPSVTPQASEEDIHREREQAYMLGYEDASKRFRTEPCEDAVSRKIAIEHIKGCCEDDGLYCADDGEIIINIIKALPSVKPKYTDEEIDKIQEIEQAYVDKMVELAVKETERPKGKWIRIAGFEDCNYEKCSVCGVYQVFYYGKPSTNFCPNCGAEMSGGGEDGKDEDNN